MSGYVYEAIIKWYGSYFHELKDLVEQRDKRHCTHFVKVFKINNKGAARNYLKMVKMKAISYLIMCFSHEKHVLIDF